MALEVIAAQRPRRAPCFPSAPRSGCAGPRRVGCPCRWPGLGKSPRPPDLRPRASPDTRRQPPSQLRRPRAMAARGAPRELGRRAGGAHTPPWPLRATTHRRPSPRPLPGPGGGGANRYPTFACARPRPLSGPPASPRARVPVAGWAGDVEKEGDLALLSGEWETSGVKQRAKLSCSVPKGMLWKEVSSGWWMTAGGGGSRHQPVRVPAPPVKRTPPKPLPDTS